MSSETHKIDRWDAFLVIMIYLCISFTIIFYQLSAIKCLLKALVEAEL